MDEHKTMAMKERELERLYGDELEQKALEAYLEWQKRRLSVSVITDADNNPVRVHLSFGPHHVLDVGMVGGHIHVYKGETHHGAMYEASSVGSQWEGVNGERFVVPTPAQMDELPSGSQTHEFHHSVADDLVAYHLRSREE